MGYRWHTHTLLALASKCKCASLPRLKISGRENGGRNKKMPKNVSSKNISSRRSLGHRPSRFFHSYILVLRMSIFRLISKLIAFCHWFFSLSPQILPAACLLPPSHSSFLTRNSPPGTTNRRRQLQGTKKRRPPHVTDSSVCICSTKTTRGGLNAEGNQFPSHFPLPLGISSGQRQLITNKKEPEPSQDLPAARDPPPPIRLRSTIFCCPKSEKNELPINTI
jgi:hypothetical protein